MLRAALANSKASKLFCFSILTIVALPVLLVLADMLSR